MDRKIELGEAIGLIAYYCLYVCVVVVGRWISQRMKRNEMLDGSSQGASARLPPPPTGTVRV